jgi:cytochrome c oxidase assembly factor CtaG
VIDWPAGESWPWKVDVVALTMLAVSAALYGRGYRVMAARGNDHGRRPRQWEAAAFAAGWATLAVALLSPIAALSDLLFSVHMTQHELLMLMAAPLLMLGRPIVVALWALPARWRVAAARPARGRMRRLTTPAGVFLLHGVTLWAWHLPAWYEAAVLDPQLHLVQHLSFVATASLFWWGMLRGGYGRLGYGTAVLYVFATAVHSGGLGALLATADAPWYPLYVARAAGHAHGALADQQLAGVIMWIPSGIVLTLLALAIFAVWLAEPERRRQRGWGPAYAGAGTGLAAADGEEIEMNDGHYRRNGTSLGLGESGELEAADRETAGRAGGETYGDRDVASGPRDLVNQPANEDEDEDADPEPGGRSGDD